MDLSFHEKGLWLVFVSLIVSFGLSALVAVVPVLPLAEVPNVAPHEIARFALAVGALVLAPLVETGAQRFLYRQDT
jgi:hypothetical protein